MDAKTCGSMGRADGVRQIGSIADHMRFRHEFPTLDHWLAYVAGFYRGAGYPGSSNRTIRREVRHGR